jgi:hypothetical protein
VDVIINTGDGTGRAAASKGSWHKHGHKSEEQLKEELVAKEKSSRVSP